MIALIITIIVMLILVGVTVTAAINGGLFEKAKIAKEGTRADEIITKRDLWKVNQAADQYSKEKTAEKLSEILTDLENQNLITSDEKETIENTGKLTIGEKTILFSVGKPYTTEDNKEIIIPFGFEVDETQGKKESDGIVIVDKTKGNEFVWVPVEGELESVTWYGSTGKSIGYDKSYVLGEIPNEIKESISTYGGFYIGRYETCKDTDGKTPIIKKGQTVWQNSDENTSMSKSTAMYENNDYVVSHLIYDAQWDAALKFIQKKDPNFILNPQDGVNGNYSGTVKSSGCYAICNIYDMGGNIDEKVMDPINISPTGNYVIRGYRKSSAATRSYGWGDAAFDWYGFRTVMYLKTI